MDSAHIAAQSRSLGAPSRGRCGWVLGLAGAAWLGLCGVAYGQDAPKDTPSRTRTAPQMPKAVQPKGATWPKGLPLLEGVTRWWLSGKDAPGHAHATVVTQGPLGARWAAWRAAFQGWKVTDERVDPVYGSRQALLRSPDGKLRAGLVLAPAGGEELRGSVVVSPAPARGAASAVRLPGPCVPIPERAFAWGIRTQAEGHDGRIHRRSFDAVHYTRFDLDVDDDGVFDALVPVPRDETGGAVCPDQLRWEVWVRRGACGHRVGSVAGRWVMVDDSAGARATGGLMPLKGETLRSEYEVPGSKPGRSPVMRVETTRRYRFKRGAYRRVSIERSGGRCHHCARVSCTAPKATAMPKAP